MNPEEARKNLDAKLSQMGYVHPEDSNSSRQPQYMSYAVTDDQMGDYVSNKPYDPYATFNAEEKVAEIQKTDFCPVCNEKAMYSCSCSLKDMMCNSGHFWYVLKNGTVKVGDPHEE